VNQQLDKLKSSSPDEFVIALDLLIAEAMNEATKEQEEAQRAQLRLDALTKERDAILKKHPPAAARAKPTR
jgi:hypothetical protein